MFILGKNQGIRFIVTSTFAGLIIALLPFHGVYAKNLKRPSIVYSLEHKVKKGECLQTIADKYGIPFPIIQLKNHMLSPKHIEIGEVLTIPTDESFDYYVLDDKNGLWYVTQKNDTLEDIASLYNITSSKIKNANKKITDPNKIVEGEKIFIPLNFNKLKLKKGYISFPIRQGDTFHSIKKWYGTDQAAIESFNPNVKTHGLRESESIIIPVNLKKKRLISHKVETDQTLFQLHNKYNVSVSDIKKWNRLQDDNIKAGDKLIIIY